MQVGTNTDYEESLRRVAAKEKVLDLAIELMKEETAIQKRETRKAIAVNLIAWAVIAIYAVSALRIWLMLGGN